MSGEPRDEMSRGFGHATAGTNYRAIRSEQTVYVSGDATAFHGVDLSELRAALASLLGDGRAPGLGPDGPLAVMHLARALEAAGEYETAAALERLTAVSVHRRSSGLLASEALAEALRHDTDREAFRELLQLIDRISERDSDPYGTGASRSNTDIYLKAPHDDEALREPEGIQGPEHTDAMAKRHGLARALVQAGRHAEALREFEELLAAREQVLGRDHPDAMAVRHDLARALAEAGRRTEALGVFEELLVVREGVLGSDHPDAMATRFDLASLYTQDGRYEEALDQLGEALAHVEHAEGGTHPDTVSLRHSVAYVLTQAGRYGEALHQLEELTHHLVRELGPDHQDTLATRHSVAHVLDQAGRYEEALLVLRQVLADRERVLGFEHQETLYACHHLASILRKSGRHHEALGELLRLLAYFEGTLGPEHRNTISVRHDLADLYSELSLHREERPDSGLSVADCERLAGRAGSQTSADSHSLDLPPLDDLFEVHEALVARLIEGDPPARDEEDAGTSTNTSDAGMGHERLLAHETAKALNADLVALLLRLGPPPETVTTDPYAPVSGGGGTTE
ncbi:tetratricopeptide repeat protein [Streptomyces chartreusis]